MKSKSTLKESTNKIITSKLNNSVINLNNDSDNNIEIIAGLSTQKLPINISKLSLQTPFPLSPSSLFMGAQLHVSSVTNVILRTGQAPADRRVSARISPLATAQGVESLNKHHLSY